MQVGREGGREGGWVAPHGRVFVRPSGTEDVVRVYAGKK